MHIVIIVLIIAVGLFLIFKAVKMILRILFVVIVLGVLYLTNPDLSAHRIAVDKKAEKESVDVSQREILRDDYKLFSFTKSKNGEHESIIGIGAVKNVWIFRL